MGTQVTGVVAEVSLSEGRIMLERQVRDRLGISLTEFFERYDQHEYDNTDDQQVLRLIMLIPYAR